MHVTRVCSYLSVQKAHVLRTAAHRKMVSGVWEVQWNMMDISVLGRYFSLRINASRICTRSASRSCGMCSGSLGM